MVKDKLKSGIVWFVVAIFFYLLACVIVSAVDYELEKSRLEFQDESILVIVNEIKDEMMLDEIEPSITNFTRRYIDFIDKVGGHENGKR